MIFSCSCVNPQHMISTWSPLCLQMSEHHNIKWKQSSHYWPFVQGIHWPPVNSLHKGLWCVSLMFSLIYTWTNSWANNWDASDLRHHRTRAAYCYRFFYIDTNTDTTFRYRYQFDPYRDIHVTILSRVRLFYTEKWRTAIKSTTHNLLQLPVQ